MSRVLIAIGCDVYSNAGLRDLTGAENDATQIFETLVNQQLGQFDKDKSHLLLSPTLSEINFAISEALFSTGAVECFTIFYAGHGGIKDGAYYLTCKDSNPQQMVLSALSTSNLFSIINESKCGHTNIIIDSCESAGFVHDISSLLKPEVIGRNGGLSVSILAAAASDQYADEINGQGICTKSILDCINGIIEVPSKRPTLDLIDLGQVVSQNVKKYAKQRPEYWGISLKGHVPLCLNPNQIDHDVTLKFTSILSKNMDGPLKLKTDELWALYFALEQSCDPTAFLESLRVIVDELDGDPAAAVDFVVSVIQPFRQRIAQNYSGFEEAEFIGAAITSILKFAKSNEYIDSVILQLCADVTKLVSVELVQLNSLLGDEKFCLLSGGFGELFYLPLRISKICGWIGAGIIISDELDIAFPSAELKTFVDLIIEHYSRSIFSVSDAQTPCVVTFITALNLAGLNDEAEVVSSLMFSSFLEVKGRIASTRISGDQVIKYLLSTETHENGELDNSSLAKPTDMLSVYFVLYEKFGLKDEFDMCLEELDHCHFNIYIPDDYRQFGEDIMTGGENYTFQIGHEVWTSSDFDSRWQTIKLHLDTAFDDNQIAIKLGSILTSLILPDRTPWFLLKD